MHVDADHGWLEGPGLFKVRLGLCVWFWRRCRDCIYVQIAVLVVGMLLLH